MANMSFALTTPQLLAQTKDVTRRMGWLKLKPGSMIQPVKKCMGLKPGEKVEKLGKPIMVTVARREPLRAMLADLAYGRFECQREGFPEMTPQQFMEMFCKTHKGCTPVSMVTRIQFAYEIEP